MVLKMLFLCELRYSRTHYLLSLLSLYVGREEFGWLRLI